MQWFVAVLMLAALSGCAPQPRNVISPRAPPASGCIQAVDQYWVALQHGPGPRLMSFSGGVAQSRLLDGLDERLRVSAFLLADVDGDGAEELVVALDEVRGASLLVLDDAARLHVVVSKTQIFPGRTTALTSGDFDGDGRDEVAIGLQAGRRASVLVLAGLDRALSVRQIVGDGWGDGRFASALAAANLDADPRAELVIGRSPGSGARLIMVDDALAGWSLLDTKGDAWGDSRGVTAIAVGQADADPQREIAVGRNRGRNERFWILDDALQRFTVMHSYGQNWGRRRAVTALNFVPLLGTAHEQLVVTRERGPNDELFLLDFHRPEPTLRPLAPAIPDGAAVGLAAVDTEGDARPELVFAQQRPGFPKTSQVVVLDAQQRAVRAFAAPAATDFSRGVVAVVRAKAQRCAREKPPPRPKSVAESKNRQMQRLENVVRAWRRHPMGDGGEFGRWETDGSLRSLRSIAAGLTALQILPSADPDRPAPDYPRRVAEWLARHARMHLAAGTDTSQSPLGRRADFDFYMMQLLMLIYRFEDEPALLSDDAIWDMLVLDTKSGKARGYGRPRVRIPLVGNSPQNMTFSVGVSFPETENHALMSNTWAYLVNQWLRNNPRRDPRTKRYYQLDPARYENEGSALEEVLLAAMGRIVRQGFFETNARPYAAYSLSALQLLFSYADASRPGGRKIRIAAQNALDYAAAKFTFQSIYGKRISPGRRNWSYRRRVGPYANDYVPFMFGVLTGATSYDDDARCRSIHCAFRGSQAKGFALSSALSEYRVPDLLLDFMLHPDNHRPGYGAWSRMQARFSDRHYIQGHWSRLAKDVPPGAPDLAGAMRRGSLKLLPAVELYFVTRSFLNSAGGRYQHYSGQDGWAFGDYRHTYDWTSRPSSLMFQGNDGYFEDARHGQRQGLMFLGEAANPARSNNIATYKNFTYGYARGGGSRAAILPTRQRVLRRFRHGDVSFEILGRSQDDGGRLVVYGEMPPRGDYRRGFWEVLPVHMTSAEDAEKCVVSRNPGLQLRGASWQYVLCASRERLTLVQDVASSARPLLEIDGSAQRAADLHLPELSDIHHFPLLETRQVDGNFRFTGVRYMSAKGDGRILINNPHLGETLLIDSSDFRAPRRLREEKRSSTTAIAEQPNGRSHHQKTR